MVDGQVSPGEAGTVTRATPDVLPKETSKYAQPPSLTSFLVFLACGGIRPTSSPKGFPASSGEKNPPVSDRTSETIVLEVLQHIKPNLTMARKSQCYRFVRKENKTPSNGFH